MKHIVIEAHCFHEESNEIPKCCLLGPGNISFNCLRYNGENNQYCKYLTFGTARATLVLVDDEGEAINANAFWADLKLSDEEWIQKENEWIDKQNKYLLESTSD